MKRSQKVLIPRLRKVPVLSAKSLSVAIASIVATGCSLKEEAYIFQSVEECGASSKFSRQECEAAYQRALIAAKETAPRYSSLSDCEREFGPQRCQPANNSSGGSFFLPLMTGFMISEAFRRNNYSHGYNPLFTYYDNGYRGDYHRSTWTTADGAKIGRSGQSTVSVGKSAFKPKPKATVTKTMSRGGFGSTAAAKSSWGGKSKSGWGG